MSTKLNGASGRAGIAAVAVVVLAGLLAACGGSSSTSSTSSAPAASSTPAASSAPAASTSSAAAAPSSGSSEAPAAPGTKLKAGQSAIVEYNQNDSGPNAKMQLTIQSIKLGSMSDFKGISLIGVPKGTVPTYVKLTMTNLSKLSLKTSTNDPADSVQAFESNGQGDNNLSISGYFPPCPDVSTPNPFTPGQTFTTCETYFEHGEATQIGWNGSDATVSDPVIWSP
jgi:hypothetical protein